MDRSCVPWSITIGAAFKISTIETPNQKEKAGYFLDSKHHDSRSITGIAESPMGAPP